MNMYAHSHAHVKKEGTQKRALKVSKEARDKQQIKSVSPQNVDVKDERWTQMTVTLLVTAL